MTTTPFASEHPSAPRSTPFSRGAVFADRAFDFARSETVLEAAAEQFGRDLVLTTAFGMEGSVLIDMVGRLGLDIRIVTLDTGLFFERTYETWSALEARYGLKIEAATPRLSLKEQSDREGEALWSRDPDACCAIRKVEPLRQVMKDARAWLTGIRRDQTPERAGTPKVGRDPRFGVVKLAPLASWSQGDVRRYLKQHRVPYNPMFDDGYPSIGCWPCTSRVGVGEDARSGRWPGHDKRECGLHWDRDRSSVRVGAPS